MADKVDSKPSRMKSGWLGSFSNWSRVPSILLLPRMLILGKWFGSEPNSVSSRTAKAGSTVFSACSTLVVPTFSSSFFE